MGWANCRCAPWTGPCPPQQPGCTRETAGHPSWSLPGRSFAGIASLAALPCVAGGSIREARKHRARPACSCCGMNETLETAVTTGTPAEFETFFAHHRERLYSALWLVTRDRYEAEDLAQDAFLKVWERWDRVGAMNDPAGYLYRTGMNLFRNRRRRALLAVKRVVHLTPADEQIHAIEQRDGLMRALGALTPGQRTALVLTDLLQMTSEEAGRALGVRPSTVRVLAARGRSALRERMGVDDA